MPVRTSNRQRITREAIVRKGPIGGPSSGRPTRGRRKPPLRARRSFGPGKGRLPTGPSMNRGGIGLRHERPAAGPFPMPSRGKGDYGTARKRRPRGNEGRRYLARS
jgi:hypothetical protein